MSNELKGFLKYLLIMFIIFLMPLIAMYFGFGAIYYSGRTLAVVYFINAIILFILYFILPVIFTYKAMKYHWSKYLDKFFYNKYLPTIVLIFFITLHSTEHIFHYSDGSSNLILGIIYVLFYFIEIFVAPIYYIAYIVLFIMKKIRLL